jgi:hypothetical protein
MRHTEDGTGDDVYVGWTLGVLQKGIREGEITSFREEKKYNPTSSVVDSLSTAERDLYDRRYTLLFQQADEDPALESHIRDIVIGEINVTRYQDQIVKLTQKLGTGAKFLPEDQTRLQLLTNLVKQTQETNLKTMNSLNLTREKKQKTQQVIETTPSRLVASYERFINGLTHEQLARQKRDEQDALGRLNSKSEQIRSMVVTEVSIE